MSQLLQQIRAAQIRAGEDAVIANLQSMGLARTERDRPAALAASEASQAKAKRDTALRDAAPELLAALKDALELIETVVPFEGDTARKARAAIRKATGDTE